MKTYQKRQEEIINKWYCFSAEQCVPKGIPFMNSSCLKLMNEELEWLYREMHEEKKKEIITNASK